MLSSEKVSLAAIAYERGFHGGFGQELAAERAILVSWSFSAATSGRNDLARVPHATVSA